MSSFIEEESGENPGKHNRRNFLTLVSLGIFGAVAAPLLVAAKRFLEPPVNAVSEAAAKGWKTLGLVAEMQGAEPVAKTISVENVAGWSRTVEDVTVYVLPQENNKVLSSVCPHEGCPVVWDAATKNFLCPCHDSLFSETGKKLTGPSQSDLTALETRVEGGNLQVKI